MYRLIGSCVGLGILWLIGLVIFAQFIPSIPNTSQHPTDGMVIFTGGKTRLQTALSLFSQKKSKYLLISGANPESPLRDIVGNEDNNPNLTLDYKASDTLGNAEETAAWAKARGIKTLRLVTSNYHMPRSVFELRHLLPDVQIIPEPVIAGHCTTLTWWKSRRTLMLVMYEYHKLLFAIICHLVEDVKSRL